jgi:microcystin-dependent protein
MAFLPTQPQPGAVAFEGRIANPDPDALTVTIDGYDGGLHAWGPCRWAPRGTVAPARGDRCLVIFADSGRPWVVTLDGAAERAVGEIVPLAGAVIPPRCLPADGRPLRRADYPALFAAIGTAYGEPSAAEFNLPDLRGRTLIGAGTGTRLSTRSLGQRGGEEDHQLIEPELASHSHPVSSPTGWTDFNVYGGGGTTNFVAITWGGAYVGADVSKYAGFNHTHTLTPAGQNRPHNTMQPYVAITYAIYTGV